MELTDVHTSDCVRYLSFEVAVHRLLHTVKPKLKCALIREEDPDEELEPRPRPRVAKRVQARFINHWFQHELGRIDHVLQQDRQRRQEAHQQQREVERRHGQHQQDDMQEEEPAVPPAEEEEEVKVLHTDFQS